MTNPEQDYFPALASRFKEIGVQQDDLQPEMWKLFFDRGWRLEVRYVAITPLHYATKVVRLLPPPMAD